MSVHFSYTETFVISVKDSNVKKLFMAELIDDFEQRLTPYPEVCEVSKMLRGLGVNKYWEFLSQNGYQIFYSVLKNSLNGYHVTAHALIHQRQDMQSLLFNRLLEY